MLRLGVGWVGVAMVRGVGAMVRWGRVGVGSGSMGCGWAGRKRYLGSRASFVVIICCEREEGGVEGGGKYFFKHVKSPV